MADLMIVYSPDDEELTFVFDGRTYALAPKDLTTVPRAALAVMNTQLGEFGVTVVSSETSKSPKELQKVIDKADETYLKGARKWAEELLVNARKRNKERSEIGLSPIESGEEISAREFLVKHKFLKETRP